MTRRRPNHAVDPAMIPVYRSEQEVHAEQTARHRELANAVVGRELRMDPEHMINRRLLDSDESLGARYRLLGQRALVYLNRKELKQAVSEGDYYNTIQINDDITAIGGTVGSCVRLHRGRLNLADSLLPKTKSGASIFWLYAEADQGELTSKSENVDFSLEGEREAVRDVLLTNGVLMDVPPVLWLGAITASDISRAEQAKDNLHRLMPRTLVTKRVAVIPNSAPTL